MSFTLSRSLSRTLLRSYGTVQGPPSAASVAGRVPGALVDATNATAPRTNWTREEISQIYNTPLNQLTYASVSHYMSSKRLGFPCSASELRLNDDNRKTRYGLEANDTRLPFTVDSTIPPPSKCAP